ncbi:MAG: CDP-glucose 4,6-dehydratase [Bacteroidota bacterium]|jgi:CDP-glucose 4,6-dehydratase
MASSKQTAINNLLNSDLLKFFKGKKVLVTGHTGFKGSWLSLILIDAGAKVAGYALSPSDVSHFNLLGIENLMLSENGDIRDKQHLNEFVTKFQPDIVFHLAAQSLVGESYKNPLETFEINVIGSVNLLEVVRHTKSVRSLVFVTSDKCYENNEWVWGYRENDRLGGVDPYSASKASAELVFNSYVKSFLNLSSDLFAASARAGNVIGGGDWSIGRIIPDCLRSIENLHPIQVRNPNSTRPWQHVLEPISGYLLLALQLFNKKIPNFEAWNFGPKSSEVITVGQLVTTFHKIMGVGSYELINSRNSKYEAGLLQLNCDKANSVLGWKPKWDGERAISETADWYKAYLAGKNIINVSRSQIGNYFVG